MSTGAISEGLQDSFCCLKLCVFVLELRARFGGITHLADPMDGVKTGQPSLREPRMHSQLRMFPIGFALTKPYRVTA